MVNIIRRGEVEPMLMPLTRMNRLFNELMGGDVWREPGLPGLLAQVEELPLPLDVSEDDKNVIVRASLPGFKKEEIGVEFQNGILSIRAEHEEVEEEKKGETFYRRERHQGAFLRQITLPAMVDEDKCEAQYKDGVLTLRIPKSQAALPRKVQIK